MMTLGWPFDFFTEGQICCQAKSLERRLAQTSLSGECYIGPLVFKSSFCPRLHATR